MKILIAGSLQADCCYEEKYIVNMLAENLKEKGYKVDAFFMPYYRDILALPEQISAYTLLDVSNADMLITVGYPACFIPHHNKIIYLLDRVPQLYEYYNSEYGMLDVPQYNRIRSSILNLEFKSFSNCKRIMVGSKALQNDLLSYHRLQSEVCYMPVIDFDYDCEEVNKPYILIESCLMPEERLEIIFESIQKSSYNLLLCIPRSSKLYKETLDKQLDEYKIKEKTVIIENNPTDSHYKNADFYITMKYESRRISNGIIRALKNNCNIIAATDSVAEIEIARDYNILLCEPNEIVLSKLLKEKRNNMYNCSVDKLPNINSIINSIGV